MNERVTEDIVREHFKRDPLFDVVKLEEQKTNVAKAKKCLSKSSKHSTGKIGYPEFIITFPAFPDDIIIVECKADAKYHESLNRDQPVNYAVDGALHYARFLLREYNVFSIAVSGADKNLKISSFYQNKNETTPSEMDNQLLSIFSYIAKIKNEYVAESIESEEITKLAIELNKELNDHSIVEYERCTLVSAILFALQDMPFRQSYKSQARTQKLEPKPERFAKAIVDAIKRVLEESEIDDARISTIINEYQTIKNRTLAKDPTIRRKKASYDQDNFVIRDITEKLESKILPLIRMGGKGHDVLGRFYREFIRYAGTDKKTGLVLTPKHITDFFCEIVNLDKDDVVFDSCCGTGGFLVSAMKYMLELAGNDEEKKTAIKQNQLIGVENRTDMFTFACSNMMMSGDGKSQIYQGDSFNDEIKTKIKRFKPTVAFLNPPYDVGEDGQLEFIKNALSYLEKGGRCVAIVQMSCATSTSKKAISVREKLFEKHTLKGVFSMPNDLFHPIGVVTCIMVFEAGNRHPDGFKSYFGYYKNDGFVKTKYMGRIDQDKWGSIKSKWLENYLNRETEAGLSIIYPVKANDEWCAEAYMETDYNKLTKESFAKSVREYLAYRIKFGLTNQDKLLTKNTHNPHKNMPLNVSEWRIFSLLDDGVFHNFQRGTRLVETDRLDGDCPLVTAGENDLGVKGFISNENQKKLSNRITIDMFCNSFCHIDEFCCDDNVIALELNSKVTATPFLMLFLITVIRQDKYRYQYGRQYRQKHLKKNLIKLPVDSSREPDWQFMEDYIKSLPYSSNL